MGLMMPTLVGTVALGSGASLGTGALMLALGFAAAGLVLVRWPPRLAVVATPAPRYS